MLKTLVNHIHTITKNMPGRKISFPSKHPKGAGSGWVFGEPASGKSGLLVIHEWWGMNEQIVKKGESLAEEGGFTVLVPDMYRGEVAIDHERAGHLMTGLDWNGAMMDLEGASDFLLKQGCSKVGGTGFCMGGALCFAAAVAIPQVVSAVAPFYGIPRSTEYDLTQIKIPVQGHFGEKDTVAGFSSKADYDALNEKLKPTGLFELFEYNAGHGFTNEKNDNYNPDATKLAMKRMFDFMHKHLNGAGKL